MLRAFRWVSLTAVVLLIVVQPAAAEESGLRSAGEVAASIDREIEHGLAEAHLPASPPADDAQFLRRVTLDLTGRIPTLERTLSFLANRNPEKRRRLIDELLAAPEYGQHCATVWRNRLAPPNPVSTKAPRDVFTPWLAEQFNRNRGWNEIVTDLLTVEGDIARHPESAFVIANSENFQPQANRLAAATARLFLGVRLQCAECHDHPFAAWKQKEFWATAAFFGRLRNTSRKGPPFILTEEPESGKPLLAVSLPAGPDGSGGEVIPPRFLGGDEPSPPGGAALRPAFTSWLTAAQNPYFAKAFVNRTWAHFFGRGLVNPVDDFRDDNPPSHPQLLARLAEEFRASGFDVKHLARCICNSQAYQRSSRFLPANARDAEWFSHAAVRPLSPEVFYDSLSILYAPHKSGEFATRSAQAPHLEARDSFIRFFRAQGEEAEAGLNQGIPQFLRRLNGSAFNQTAPLIASLVEREVPRSRGIELLYLATLTRQPTAEEVELMNDYLQRRPNTAEGYAGVLWILLNTGEFVLNH
jgi:hypothetical protein